jgi:beta-glucosidase
VGVSVDDGVATVRGSVRNTGHRDGADVVQVYAELPDPGAPPRLVGFARVEVAARGEAAFEITVPTARLARRDADQRAWLAPVGRHRLVVARFAGDPDATDLPVDL